MNPWLDLIGRLVGIRVTLVGDNSPPIVEGLLLHNPGFPLLQTGGIPNMDFGLPFGFPLR